MRITVPISIISLILVSSMVNAQIIKAVTTTQTLKFKSFNKVTLSDTGHYDAAIVIDNPLQKILGFGGCFNELGWTSLNSLAESDREEVMKELFAPGVGASFNICRMPIGANDFSLKWYSYDEVDQDFEMKNFSISNDQSTLVPFIKSALRYQSGLKLWASPWSPPQWMKYNHHYAEAMFAPTSTYGNGITQSQTGKPGTDMFVQDEQYFKAYALYFSRFIEAYKQEGIKISMVMPQNEFLSPQVFPSCTWTAAGLERFLTYLGPRMEKDRVDVFFGTMNSNKQSLADTILSSRKVSRYIKGAGFQWSGKGAIGPIHQRYPQITLYQTEQECGNGKNDWAYCKYTWGLIKHYFNNGANAYMYWNIALQQGGVSHWGWHQNSLVTVDSVNKQYTFNYEYYLLKHLSHFVKPGANLLSLSGASNNMLAFRNPDRSFVLVIQNEDPQDKMYAVKVGSKIVHANLKGDSFNTIMVKDMP